MNCNNNKCTLLGYEDHPNNMSILFADTSALPVRFRDHNNMIIIYVNTLLYESAVH